MGKLDGTYGTGPAKVTVKYLDKAVRQLERAGADMQDMKTLMHELGMIVVRQAQGDVPVESGVLRDTIRAGRGKNKAVVRAGGVKSAPYGPVIHYGNPHTGLSGNPFLVGALQAKRTEVFDEFKSGLDRVLKKNDLI